MKLVLDDENFHEKVLSGFTANVTIVTKSRNDVLLVKTSLLSEKDGKQSVHLVKNGLTIQTEVETGMSSNGMTEVIAGLSEGDTLQSLDFQVESTSSSTSASSLLPTPGNRSSSRSSSSSSSSQRDFGPPGGF